MAPEPQPYSPNPALTPDQLHVLSLLAEGHSLTEAAAEVGIHRNTVRNWRRSVPAFAREHDQAVREQAAFWHDRAVSLAGRAAKVLDEILDDPNVSPAVRLRAALAVLKEAASPQLESTHNVHNSLATNLPDHQPAPTHLSIAVHNENSESCTTVHNAHKLPIRRAPEPGRNTQCPCGSGLKYKRCCASYAPPRPTLLSAAA